MDQLNSPRRHRRSLSEQNRITQGYWLGVLLLAIVFSFTLFSLLAPDAPFSDNENRTLAQKPTLSMDALTDGSYFSNWETYTADQFFQRDFWVSLRLSCAKFLGQRESNGVYLCDDDYLIQVPSEPDWEKVDTTLAAVNKFSARHPEMNHYMLMVPNAVSILDNKLPDNAPGRDQAGDMKYLKNGLSGLSLLDPTPALNKHSNEQLYYRTDHHWTSLGAYYAYQYAATTMKLGSMVQGYQTYTVSNSFEGTLASRSGDHSVRDVIQVYSPNTQVEYRVTYESAEGEQKASCSLYQRDRLFEKDQYLVFFGGNHPKVVIETTADTGKTLLLLKDSYANSFVQFIYPYYDKIVMIDPRYYYENLESVLAREKVTDVLYLYNLDTFLSDTSLKDVLETVE